MIETRSLLPSIAVALLTCGQAQGQPHTAYEFISLHPVGSTFSEATAAYGGRQFGNVGWNGVGQGVMWSGTPLVVRNLGADARITCAFGR